MNLETGPVRGWPGSSWSAWRRARRPLETKVVLDWDALPPVQRIELMTTHDLAKREKQKLELLRSLLTYFHYASKETRPEVFDSFAIGTSWRLFFVRMKKPHRDRKRRSRRPRV